jgi:hypothetical protein
MAQAEFIERLEKYIENNESQGHLDKSCFSPTFYRKRIQALKEAEDSKEANVFHIGCNGYRSYFYFKSKNAKLYLIELYLDDINDYSCI